MGLDVKQSLTERALASVGPRKLRGIEPPIALLETSNFQKASLPLKVSLIMFIELNRPEERTPDKLLLAAAKEKIESVLGVAKWNTLLGMLPLS